MKQIYHRTHKGRIVYKSKYKHVFKWRDAFRIANRLFRTTPTNTPWTVNQMADFAYLFSLTDLCMKLTSQMTEYPANYLLYWPQIKVKWTNPRSIRKRSEQNSDFNPDDHQFTFRSVLDFARMKPNLGLLAGWWLQKKILAILPLLDIINEIKGLSEA